MHLPTSSSPSSCSTHEESLQQSTHPVVVLGATGYVGGELLRLVAGHPRLHLAAALSTTRAGIPVQDVFPHLASVYPEHCLQGEDGLQRLLLQEKRLAILSATPHGETAALVQRWLAAADHADCEVQWIDLSADFRLTDVDTYQELYQTEHAAPELLPRFRCAPPDLVRGTPAQAIAHPGCFTTAVTLATAALHGKDLVEPRYHVTAITGSTGSGRSPGIVTHHPERHGNVRSYAPLVHRHEAEMEQILQFVGDAPARVLFAPQSGPFARGIYATVHVRLTQTRTTDQLVEEIAAFYAASPFVSVAARPPSLKDVVGTNRCHLGVAVRGDSVVIHAAIDNLLKGAAGGALQWLNRMLDWPEHLGLDAPAPAWC